MLVMDLFTLFFLHLEWWSLGCLGASRQALQLSWPRWMHGEILWWNATTKRSCRYHGYTACQLCFAIWSTQKPLTCPSCGASGFRLRGIFLQAMESIYIYMFIWVVSFLIGSVHRKCQLHPFDHTIERLLPLEYCWQYPAMYVCIIY